MWFLMVLFSIRSAFLSSGLSRSPLMVDVVDGSVPSEGHKVTNRNDFCLPERYSVHTEAFNKYCFVTCYIEQRLNLLRTNLVDVS